MSDYVLIFQKKTSQNISLKFSTDCFFSKRGKFIGNFKKIWLGSVVNKNEQYSARWQSKLRIFWLQPSIWLETDDYNTVEEWLFHMNKPSLMTGGIFCLEIVLSLMKKVKRAIKAINNQNLLLNNTYNINKSKFFLI